MKKVLIIRFSSIGDIVLTTPVIRCVKQQLEGAQVHYITKSAFASILESNPYVDQVHVFKEDLTTVIDELKTENFDYIIDLHNNLRSRRVTTALGVPQARFHKLNVEKWLMVNLKVNQLPDLHIVDRYVDAAKKLGVKNDGAGLDFFIPEGERVSMDLLPNQFKDGYVALVIGAKQATKKMPIEKLIALVSDIKLPVVLIGGPEDAEDGNKIAEAFPVNTFNACGKFNLNGSASLIEQAKAVVTHDTGMMHVAAAFNKPIFSIWGNTVPEFGMSPYLPNSLSTIFEVDGLNCRPCSKIGYQECPKGHFDCMNKIDLGSITQSLNKLATK